MERNRSQASVLREQKLRDDLAACLARIGVIEKQISKAKADAESCLTGKIEGKPNGVALDGRLREIDEMRREVKALKEREASLQSQIEALRPTAAQNRARVKVQKAIVRAVGGFAKQVEQLDAAVLNAQIIDKAAQELLAKIGKAAATIELELPRAWSSRLDEMLGSLPGESAPEMRNSVKGFLGEDERPKRFVVRRKVLTLPETLFDHGVYLYGEEIRLSEEQAAKLLREAPASDPPILPLAGAAALKPGAKKVKIEVLRRVEHDGVPYDPGVHVLPRATALALLAVTIPVTRNKRESGVELDAEPVARLCA